MDKLETLREQRENLLFVLSLVLPDDSRSIYTALLAGIEKQIKELEFRLAN